MRQTYGGPEVRHWSYFQKSVFFGSFENTNCDVILINAGAGVLTIRSPRKPLLLAPEPAFGPRVFTLSVFPARPPRS